MDGSSLNTVTRKTLLKKIDEIAAVLVAAPNSTEIGLYAGKAGVSLFLFYNARFKNDTAMHQKATDLMDSLFAQIEATFRPPLSLCSGIAGVCWTIDHLCKQEVLDANPNELLSDIDEYIYQAAHYDLNRGHFDFLHGAIGMMLYLIKRNCRDYLDHLVRVLNNVAVWDDGCAKWQSMIRHEEGALGFNIALSHGSSAIAIVLCKILQMMPKNETVKRLLEGTVGYILDQEISVTQYGCYFPAFSIESQQEFFKTRLAWCYGDLGIGLAIWQAGLHLHNQAWIEKGMEVLLHSARRRGLMDNKVVDAGICHGTAGIAQIFNRLFRSTIQIEFQEAANYWCMETLKMAKFDDGFAGYKSWYTPEHGGWQCKDNLLDGIAGIGLSLLSFVMHNDPAWDECLLLS